VTARALSGAWPIPEPVELDLRVEGPEARGLTDADIRRLEEWIDRLEAELPPLRRFILPGGNRAGALLHFSRTVCRRAERAIVALGTEHVDAHLLAYVNRLSDLLFVIARVVNHRAGQAEVEW